MYVQGVPKDTDTFQSFVIKKLAIPKTTVQIMKFIIEI